MSFSAFASNHPHQEKETTSGETNSLMQRRRTRRKSGFVADGNMTGENNHTDMERQSDRLSPLARERCLRGWSRIPISSEDESGDDEDGSQDSWKLLTALHPRASVPSSVALIDAHKIDTLLTHAAAFTFVIWVFITTAVYASSPRDNRVYLRGAERNAALFAFVAFAVMILSSVLPCVVGLQWNRRVSGVMISGLVIHLIALVTNAVITWGPTVVYADPVTTSPAYLTRYCEWMPLAGFMTFLSEVIDLPQNVQSMTLPVISALLQFCSAGCGILCPLCPNALLWWTVMGISCLAFSFIFVRVWQKRKRYLMEIDHTGEVRTAAEMEHRERVVFGYRLVVACALFWSGLVALYFVNMAIFVLTPPDHFLRVPGLAMLLDTLFDVAAKIVYTQLIMSVHDSVFDKRGQAQRRLQEIRGMLRLLWESSSDVIIVLVPSGKEAVSVMMSPAFDCLIGGFRSSSTGMTTGDDRKSLAMEFKMQPHPDKIFRFQQPPNIESQPPNIEPQPEVKKMGSKVTSMELKRAFLESSHESVNEENHGLSRVARLHVPLSDHGVVEAKRLIHWICRSKMENGDVIFRDVVKKDGSVAKCEIKVNKKSHSGAMVALVRDVSLRYRSAEAEQRTILEAIARHNDAQTANQFTRHHIKNGLLGSIELCDSLRTDLMELSRAHQSVPIGIVDELDATLNETLEAILNEAMSRDLIHQVYHPRLERINVLSTIESSRCAQRSKGETHEVPPERCPVFSRPSKLPLLSLDPQLIKYVHRHVVSNACKFGKADGPITTDLCYSEETKHFVMTVTNLPGANHLQLLALGAEAEAEVFSKGNRLRSFIESRLPPSSLPKVAVTREGGCWMIQKCAEVIGGKCWIRFHHDKTVFSFQCPAHRCDEGSSDLPPRSSAREPSQFTVPEGTWGIAVDDSKIQRKLVSKLLVNAGVPVEKQVILGETAEEIRKVVSLMLEVVNSNPNSHVLILMDENLDFVEDGKQMLLSGSKKLREMLLALAEEDSDRILALVRSANDSSADLSLYSSRSHGYFPKTPMTPDRVREVLSGLWYDRFHESCRRQGLGCQNKQEQDAWKETKESLLSVGHLVSQGMTGLQWCGIREGLGRLKENLLPQARCSPKVKLVVELLEGMKDSDAVPLAFDETWRIIQGTVSEAAVLGRSGNEEGDSAEFEDCVYNPHAT